MGSRGAAAPPDFENPKKLSHKNAIKPNFSEKWGKIGLLAPPLTFGAREAPGQISFFSEVLFCQCVQGGTGSGASQDENTKSLSVDKRIL